MRVALAAAGDVTTKSSQRGSRQSVRRRRGGQRTGGVDGRERNIRSAAAGLVAALAAAVVSAATVQAATAPSAATTAISDGFDAAETWDGERMELFA